MTTNAKDFPNTIADLIQRRREDSAGRIALIGVDREPLTYRGLAEFVDAMGDRLAASGLTYPARIAVVMPNGPEMAAAFLSVASKATCAPLNPAYRRDEFEFYLSDLCAAAVMIDASLDCSVREVATKMRIAVLEVNSTSTRPSGCFEMAGDILPIPAAARLTQPEDVSLILHTSGTTSRPKLVPLSQANLCASAQNIRRTLELLPDDRCLNVMPLFHIHGLVGCLLSTLATGASLACSPGFESVSFFSWLREYLPTWYSAVPTMHQAILQEAARQATPDAGWPLRFIRSSSSALPPTVLAELEKVFGAPVVEAYGMTEAAHQMCCNPLPPKIRKPGTVGLPAGPEVVVIDAGGNLVPTGAQGEIAIRGSNVTAGYESNPKANEDAFTNGWFRTGDRGFLDENGYLTIVGRIKEIVNRGGEKISPREIDETLLEHPAIQQAVAFAVPHLRLGEDLAVAVVVKPGARLSEQEVRDFAFSKLADFKVPSQVVFVSAIPKGPTGKLQRIGLYEHLKDKMHADYVAPSTSTEKLLAVLWIEVLGGERVGLRQNFFGLGGDSLLAMQVVSRIRDAFGIELPVPTIFREPTIAALGKAVDLALVQQLAAQKDASALFERVEQLSDEETERLLMEIGSDGASYGSRNF